MRESWMLILGAVLPMFCVIGVGSVARLAGWLSRDADQSLLRLILYVFLPCLALNSVLGNEALSRAETVLWPPLVGYGSILLGAVVALLVAHFGYPITGLADARQRRTFAFAAGTQNYGYLALSLVTLLFDRRTLGVLFVHNIGAELAFWTISILVLRGELGRQWWKQVLNPPSVAIVAALVLNAFHVGQYVPDKLVPALTTGVVWLGQAAMPLALILTGAIIVDELRPNGNNVQPKGDMAKWLGWSCTVRMGVFPLLFLLGAVYLPATDELKRVIAVQAAMPSAVFSIIMTRVYSGQPGIALRIVLVTSLVSLLTIPFWIPVGLGWLGVVASGN